MGRKQKTIFEKVLATGLAVLVGSSSSASYAAVGGISANQTVERPKQFVFLAFDGSKANHMWRETREFADRLSERLGKRDGEKIRFTYFINSSYFVPYNSSSNSSEYKALVQLYKAPGHARGASAIGWGDNVTDVVERYGQLNAAFKEGHELASHAVGHFNAGPVYEGSGKNARLKEPGWSEEGWKDEFVSFVGFLFGTFLEEMSYLKNYTPKLIFSKDDITGFRAPQLGMSEGLWPTLAANNFRYDTSKSGSPNRWPSRNAKAPSVWDFPLGVIPIDGTYKEYRVESLRNNITLSMDYNFLVSQSCLYLGNCTGNPSSTKDPKLMKIFEEEMLASYKAYFERNYYGNRAPVHIGHHFAQYNGGAYWRAMQRFAEWACGQPEVECATYSKLADFMSEAEKTPGLIAAYQDGRFPKMQAPARLSSLEDAGDSFDANLKLALDASREMLVPSITGSDAKALVAQGATIEATLNGQKLGGQALDMNTIRNMTPKGSSAEIVLRLKKGDEALMRSTHSITNVGTANEEVKLDSWEEHFLNADPAEAHLDE